MGPIQIVTIEQAYKYYLAHNSWLSYDILTYFCVTRPQMTFMSCVVLLHKNMQKYGRARMRKKAKNLRKKAKNLRKNAQECARIFGAYQDVKNHS